VTTTKSTIMSVALSGNGGIFSGCFHKVVGFIDPQSTEIVYDKTQIITAFTWQDLGFQLTGTGAVTTIKSRNNGGAGNQTVSSTLNTPGWYADSTHTDSVTANTPIDINRSTNNGPNVTLVSSTMAASSPLSLQGSNSNASSASFSTTKQFGYVNGSIIVGPTETDLQITVRAAGTWKNSTLAIATSPTNAVTFTVRKNAADGNQTISISGGTAANTILSDSTHTDSIVAGDLINQSAIQVTSASGSMRWCTSEFVGTTSGQDVGSQADSASTLGVALSASTSYYWALGGQLITNTTEVNAKFHTPYAFTLSKIRCRIYTNTASTMTLKSRVNGADGNGTVSVSSGTTGFLEDSTHTDSCSVGNDVNLTAVTGSVTTLSIKNAYATMDDGSVVGFSTETGTVIMTLAGVSFVGSGHKSETGTGNMALTKASFVGSGTHNETGTGNMALTKASFVGVGGRKETGTGSMALQGISFTAQGSVVRVKGAAVMTLHGISIVGSGFNVGQAGSGVRQFWTF
jgi:hypothetical protein